MKLTSFILLIGMLQVGMAAVGQKISLSEQNAPLAKVFKKISQQSGFGFMIEGSLLKMAKPVTINVRDAELETVLAGIFANQPLQFTISEQAVIIKAKEQLLEKATEYSVVYNMARQQPGRISGKVLDDHGQPLSGASIRIVQTGQSVQSKVDGSYNFSIVPGTYTLEITYVSFQPKRITEVAVTSGQLISLNVVLKAATGTLDQVVVTSSFKRESTIALYARQQNEAGISNGISREQISALPDKNVGETLKRISGISTNDNRRIVIRGIAERYNLAMMDGATLPSTDVQVRDFEFDIVPSNLIDNIIISKTATPDMSFGFGGGLVQINTLSIPDNNFTTIGLGVKYINGSTGKDFLGYGRGKNDYLGFDDGTRDHFPKDLIVFDAQNYNPRNPYAAPAPGITPVTPAMIAEQNKRIGGLERMGTRTYTAAPGQNYQFSLGRSYNFKNSRFGFVGSLSYRNEQAIDNISHFERGNWEKIENRTYNVETGEEITPTYSAQYNFNTTWGALFNLGWSSKNHKITFRNFYSRVFSNQFSRIVGWGNDIGFVEKPAIREYDRPKFIDMLQSRINGEHSFGAFRLEWNLARNTLNNLEQDAVEAWLNPTKTLNETTYNIMPTAITNAGTGTFNRGQYHYRETNKIAEGALNYQVNVLGQKQLVKAGYQFMDRHGVYDWVILPIGTAGGINPYVPAHEWNQYLEFKDPLNDLFYYPAAFSASGYEGKNINQAVYGMMDNRFTSWLRLVWGVRAEYYKYERVKSGANDMLINALTEQEQKRRYVDPETGKIVSPVADPETEEKTWRYLPSASLTANPFKNVNIRAAYSESVVRPALIENSRMVRVDPALGGSYRRNEGVLSTVIDHYDLRLEWYPKAGEVISMGYFYKYFDKPVELYRHRLDASYRVYVTTNNSEWAKVHGWEFDMRKSLGFIRPQWKFLDNLYLSGNLTLQSSTVQSAQFEGMSMPQDKYGRNYEYRTKKLLKEKRPLYGQVPVLYNIGLQYTGSRLGANIAFNHMGYKTFMTAMEPSIVEYERPRNQLDAQLSYRFLKNKKLDVRLNMSNLLNSAYRFYVNSNETYKLQSRWEGMAYSAIPASEWNDIYEWKYGFSQKYEEGYYQTSADGKTKTRVGDRDSFIRKIGSSFSLSVAYTL
ncbi:TonB-dependent receptor [Filimonas effusa]|uniref:TonB-dependent receptor n=1 Tax=Filimonas effusa TaxID=2508721 RepID=A0A4Q1D0N2_9BACT|nr:TonB-dependent receptor [Filimonas effusa]RXK81313.1 TonB-dependent receptor [Filimonas effusa]